MARHFKERGMGLLVEKELEALVPLLTRPRPPFVLILGGAKVKDKIGVVRNLLPKLGQGGKLLIGGGMAFTFLKAQGTAVGGSLVDDTKLGAVGEVLAEARRLGVAVLTPRDFRVAAADGGAAVVTELRDGQAAMDIGPQTARDFTAAVQSAATLFWNGPLGVFEEPRFAEGTCAVAKAVAALKAITVIGGGDTLAAFSTLKLLDRLTHASTGGGATLEFLEGRELPGLNALLAS
jgi:phosphoglycerate kinase